MLPQNLPKAANHNIRAIILRQKRFEFTLNGKYPFATLIINLCPRHNIKWNRFDVTMVQPFLPGVTRSFSEAGSKQYNCKEIHLKDGIKRANTPQERSDQHFYLKTRFMGFVFVPGEKEYLKLNRCSNVCFQRFQFVLWCPELFKSFWYFLFSVGPFQNHRDSQELDVPNTNKHDIFRACTSIQQQKGLLPPGSL